MNYSEQIKHPKWQKKRLEIMKRDRFTCKLCGDKETQLHIHHKEYINGNDPWDYDNKLLITLCEDCHTEIENIKKDDPDIIFESIHIYKSNHWTDGSKIMFVSAPFNCSMIIYNKNGTWLDGFDLNEYEMKNIIKIFKKSLNV